MRNFLVTFLLFLTLACCSNSPELETGEIKTLQLLKQSFEQYNDQKIFIDARNLLSREQINEAAIPILFVELESGQNGTLTLYPGQGVGQTWLGADGATITLEKGILIASRGMGDDLMGSSSSMPQWSKINRKTGTYSREVAHITGNNKIAKRVFTCDIEKISSRELIEIWDINFRVTRFEEICFNDSLKIKNTYFVDTQNVVRRSTCITAKHLVLF